MNEIASKSQLRMSYLRWAMVTVPAILFLGLLSGRLSNSGFGNRWFAALAKPDLMPPGLAFAVVWPVLYVLMGLALAMILHARGARGRGLALMFFLVQLICNLAWSPVMFARHELELAFYLVLVILALATITTVLFARIRMGAALLMLPYLAWLAFASLLAYQIMVLNPAGEKLVVPVVRTQI